MSAVWNLHRPSRPVLAALEAAISTNPKAARLLSEMLERNTRRNERRTRRERQAA